MDFHIAPLEVPHAPELTLDGRCDDAAYGALSLALSPYADGEVAYASVARTADHLWVCLQGLQGAGEYAGFQIDVDNSQAPTVQESDLGFFVRMDGTPVVLAGDGENFTSVSTDGLAVRVSGDNEMWSAELRVDVDALGGWNRRVALGIGHYLNDERAVWPHTATLENPQSWAQTNLGAEQTLSLTALSPESATAGSSFELTVTGAGFQADTVILWDGVALDTTHEDSETLLTTVDAGLIETAGLYHVQVAPEGALALASAPMPFLVFNPQPQVHALAPDSAPEEGEGFVLTVDGAGFVEGATVLWDGEERATTFVSNTRLEAQIPAEDLAVAGPVAVQVANPDPSAGISDVATFLVERTGPVFTTIGAVYQIEPRKYIPGASARVESNRTGATMQLNTSELTPGHAVTVWWVIFNNPEACAGYPDEPCTMDDLMNNTEAVGGEVTYAAGNFVGGSGVSNFAGRLQVGHTDQEWFGNGFTNPMGAEIHLVVRSHGARIPGLANEMIRTFRGGCENVPEDHPAADDGRPGPNMCEDVQIAILRQ